MISLRGIARMGKSTPYIDNSFSQRLDSCSKWLGDISKSFAANSNAGKILSYKTNKKPIPRTLSSYNVEREFTGRASPKEVEQTMFAYTISALAAKLMQIDGEVTASKIRVFLQLFLLPNVSPSKMRLLFSAASKDNAPYLQYARQINKIYANNLVMRKEMLLRLVRVAMVDSPISYSEYDFFLNIGKEFRLSTNQIALIISDAMVDLSGDFHNILKVQPTATLDEIQKSYHKIIRDCHPDRWSNIKKYHEFYLLCTQKSQAVNGAYIELMKQKNIDAT